MFVLSCNVHTTSTRSSNCTYTYQRRAHMHGKTLTTIEIFCSTSRYSSRNFRTLQSTTEDVSSNGTQTKQAGMKRGIIFNSAHRSHTNTKVFAVVDFAVDSKFGRSSFLVQMQFNRFCRCSIQKFTLVNFELCNISIDTQIRQHQPHSETFKWQAAIK